MHGLYLDVIRDGLPHHGARRDTTGVRLYTRNGHDFSKRFPRVVAALAALPARFCPRVSAYRERPVQHVQLEVHHSHGACPETTLPPNIVQRTLAPLSSA